MKYKMLVCGVREHNVVEMDYHGKTVAFWNICLAQISHTASRYRGESAYEIKGASSVTLTQTHITCLHACQGKHGNRVSAQGGLTSRGWFRTGLGHFGVH